MCMESQGERGRELSDSLYSFNNNNDNKTKWDKKTGRFNQIEVHEDWHCTGSSRPRNLYLMAMTTMQE